METVKATGTINKQGQLTLDQPLDLPENSRVEIIVLVQDAVPNATGDAEYDLSKEELLADFRQALVRSYDWANHASHDVRGRQALMETCR